jgi:hypothetical protein
VVDGFDSSNNTIYEFNGCYFHGHNCELNPHEFNEKCNLPMSELYRRTLERQRFLEVRSILFLLDAPSQCVLRTQLVISKSVLLG